MKQTTTLNKFFPNQSTTKTLFVMAVVTLAGVITGSFWLMSKRAVAAPPMPISEAAKSYDPIVLPITNSSLQDGLIHNSRDAQAEYQLLLRAGYQHHEKLAYDTMNRLRVEQPNNPIALAGYFMALRMAEGGMNSMRYNGGCTVLTVNHWDDDDAAALLHKAYQLAPRLWITYAVEGEDKIYEPNANHKLGIALLQKAEHLAPEVPYVHWLLGDAYTLTPISPEKYQMAAIECKKALASGKPISDAAFILFQLYSLLTPNPTEEIKWKRKYLSMVPPNVKISPEARKWLDRFPG